MNAVSLKIVVLYNTAGRVASADPFGGEDLKQIVSEQGEKQNSVSNKANCWKKIVKISHLKIKIIKDKK